VKFAYSMGFSEISDRMVWPPFLSRDLKWPRPPIRRKTPLWMRVTPVAYKLERSVMGQKMRFGDRYVLYGVRTKNLIISTIFRKTRNSLFPQCNTSIIVLSYTVKQSIMGQKMFRYHVNQFGGTNEKLHFRPFFAIIRRNSLFTQWKNFNRK